jgi:hypothetical protein
MQSDLTCHQLSTQVCLFHTGVTVCHPCQTLHIINMCTLSITSLNKHVQPLQPTVCYAPYMPGMPL